MRAVTTNPSLHVKPRKNKLLSVVLTYAVIVSCFLGTAAQTRGDQFTFTYSDPYGDFAHGMLTAVPSGLADSSLWVISGSLTITANPQYLPPGNVSSIFPSNHYVGTYNLLPLGPLWTPLFDNQTSGDNLIYPSRDAYSTAQPIVWVPGASYLDGGGLMFGSSNLTINIYAVGNDVYGFQIVNAAVNGVHGNTDLGAWGPEMGAFQLTAIPEPASLALLALGGAAVLLCKRRWALTCASSIPGGLARAALRQIMKKGTSLVLEFLAQLAGFILGSVAGLLPACFVLWLLCGAPTGPDSGGPMFAPMLLVGPVGLLIGGFVGMRLAGKWLNASSHREARPGSRNTPE